MRWLGILLIIGSLAAGAVLVGRDLHGLSQGFAPEVAAAPPAAEAARRIFAHGIVEGTVRDIPLRFEVAGRLRKIHVREGDTLQAGQLLAELDAETWGQRVAEAEARLKLVRAERERLINGARIETRQVLKSEVKTTEVQVREAESLFNRSKELAKRNAVSAQELDDTRFRYERAQAHLQAAQARLSEIDAPAREDDVRIADARIALAEATLKHERSLLEKASLRAPTDGVVLHIHVESGELVGPEDERALFAMTNRDHTRVRAFVEELDALNVVPGQTARVIVDGRHDKSYEGVVLSCAPSVIGKTHRHHKPGELIDIRVREVVIELRDADDLVIGLPVDAFIDQSPPPAPAETTSPVPEGDQKLSSLFPTKTPARRSGPNRSHRTCEA